MAFGIHPVIVIAAFAAILALIAVVIACVARSGVMSMVMGVLALVFLLPAVYVFLGFHPELIDARFRTYKTLYRDIQIGMTRNEVLATVDRLYPKAGKRQRPKVFDDQPDQLGFFMNPETSTEPNCEGISVMFKNGRVTKKEYLPD